MVRHKRRQFFINKEFQGKYIFNAFIAVAVGSVLFALVFSFFSSNSLSIVYENYHLKLGTTPSLLLNKILSTQWLFIVLAGIAVAVATLFFSHRVAGPVYRFEKTLDSMTAKDLSCYIRLRRKDEGKVLAEKINCFNEMLSNSIHRMRQTSEKIEQCCAAQSGDDGQTQRDLLITNLEEIKHHNKDVLEILSEFKLRIE